MQFDLKRREFVTLFGGAVASWPLAARAQQQVERVRRIGVLMSLPENDPEAQRRFDVIRAELEKRGWFEGRNVQIDARWYGGQLERQQALAKELIELRPEIVIAQSTTAVIAFLGETRTIPIVFVNVTDPVGQGFVLSLARPAHNITGFSNFEPTIGGKWLGLLKELLPELTRVTMMVNPETAPYFGLYVRSLEAAATSYSVRVTAGFVRNTNEIEQVLTMLGNDSNHGLILPPDVFTSNHRRLINEAVIRYRIPSLYSLPYLARDGGLLSYGPDVIALYQGLVSYVDRILRGERAGDLPVQFPIKFELVINLRTAKGLRIEVPPALLALADEVIE
jgi:putative ABC transport system substrate-binding protein